MSLTEFSIIKLIRLFVISTDQETKTFIYNEIQYRMYYDGILPGLLGDIDPNFPVRVVGIYKIPLELDARFRDDSIYDGLCKIEGDSLPTDPEFSCTDSLALRLFSVAELPKKRDYSYIVRLRINKFDHKKTITEILTSVALASSECPGGERASPFRFMKTLLFENPELYEYLANHMTFDLSLDYVADEPYGRSIYEKIVEMGCEKKYPKICTAFDEENQEA